MKDLKFKVWFSTEDECWIARAKGFPNAPKQRAHGHGSTPGIAVLECTIAANLMLELFPIN
jgi:hypothetical protein